MATKWAGSKPETCDTCEHLHGMRTPLTTGWVDGKTKMGQWANMCRACHKRYGVGLGTGRGQQYDADGVKVAG